MNLFRQKHGRHKKVGSYSTKTWRMTVASFSVVVAAATLLSILMGTSSQAASPIGSAGAIHLDIAANAETPIALRVQPKATCTLPQGNPSQKIFANDEGVVRMNVRPTREGTGIISLECLGENGASVTYPVELAPTSDPGLLGATKDRMKPLFESKPGTQRRALTGDPMAYTQKELLAGGYGERPDPVTEADRYAHWLRAATKPSTLVSSRRVAGSEYNGPNENQQWGPNWSGGVAGNPGGAWPNSGLGSYFWYASAEWNVPQVFAESSFANQSNASTWAGFGGTNGDYLWQAGTGEWTQSAFWFQISGYNAWTEVYPNESQQNISNFSVNNGDDVYAEVFVCDPSSGAENPTWAGYVGLCAHVHNYTQNEDSFTPMWFSEFAGLQNAEVIQERPDSGSGQNDYAQFNAFNFISTDVCSSDGHDFVGGCNAISANYIGLIPGPSPFTTTMAQIGSPSHPIGQSCMADYNGACDDKGDYVHVWWDAHN